VSRDFAGTKNRSRDQLRNELERAVFNSVYFSTVQQRRRWTAVTLLSLKHGLRGLLFSWPLYLLGLMAFAVPGRISPAYLVLFLPGVLLSVLILSRGVKEDYSCRVDGFILEPGDLRRILSE